MSDWWTLILALVLLTQLGPVPALAGSPVPSPTPIVSVEPSLRPAPAGARDLRVLSPTMLELSWVVRVPGPAPTSSPPGIPWTLAPDAPPPAPSDFEVRVQGRPVGVRRTGVKQRCVYAPLKRDDLRAQASIFLELMTPVPEGARVAVTSRGPKGTSSFAHAASATRWSPCIHVNQEGYAPDLPKRATTGFYLGTLGELPLDEGTPFEVRDERSGQVAFHGRLQRRPDQGLPQTPPPYQQVFVADFTALRTPGTYRLRVEGLGESHPFAIDSGIAATFARTYALGIYHQRCGAPTSLPFTRFVHAACHLAPAFVPTPAFARVQQTLAGWARNRKQGLGRLEDSLYPFVRRNRVDVHGGHHDAGDYSKYTIDSAQMIHALVFAADSLPGVGDLDNLGLPESGNGKSDLLEIARHEAEFLSRMQDTDGGFYFLVYPRDRPYEDNVPPDRGDPQCVYPKNTSATAAAVAALAQTATSPRFRREFPREADRYLADAKRGWAFLQRAWKAHGRERAYQRLTHYGDAFGDRDEIAWAETEMYLATGDPAVHALLLKDFRPGDRSTLMWQWWRLYESYGCAVRSYAFAARSGRLPESRLAPRHLDACRQELLAAAADLVTWARASAYGTSHPLASKRHRTAGWYFPVSASFDLAVAQALAPRPAYRDAIVSNLDFEAGNNPVNVCFIPGLGWKRPQEIVNQFAQNDARALPPSGIPEGSLQAGFGWVARYGRRLGALSIPSDGDPRNPYPIYDRWSDAFNVTTEAVTAVQARGLATLCSLMASTPQAHQPWRAAPARIEGVPARVVAGVPLRARLRFEGAGFQPRRVTWEGDGVEPVLATELRLVPREGMTWLEAEAQAVDGRRAFAVVRFETRPR